MQWMQKTFDLWGEDRPPAEEADGVTDGEWEKENTGDLLNWSQQIRIFGWVQRQINSKDVEWEAKSYVFCWVCCVFGRKMFY